MSGKGQKRRPLSVTPAEFARQWDQIFSPKAEQVDVSTLADKPQSKFVDGLTDTTAIDFTSLGCGE